MYSDIFDHENPVDREDILIGVVVICGSLTHDKTYVALFVKIRSSQKSPCCVVQYCNHIHLGVLKLKFSAIADIIGCVQIDV